MTGFCAAAGASAPPAAVALRVVGPFALGYFLSYLYRAVNAVIDPDLAAELGLSAGDLGQLTAANLLSFPAHLAGRVNTALNLLVFVAAFAAQWGLGEVVGRWTPGPAASCHPAGYRVGFGLLLAVQAGALGWFVLAERLRRRAVPTPGLGAEGRG